MADFWVLFLWPTHMATVDLISAAIALQWPKSSQLVVLWLWQLKFQSVNQCMH